jgi:peptide/nickel transport system ATP-binding protein
VGLRVNKPLLQVDHLTRTYTLPRETLWQAPRRIHAVQEVSLRVFDGKNMGVVGESGSGKSTLARLVMALEPPTSGSVTLLGQNLDKLNPAVLRKARQNFQMVFQDPYGSLDPRQTIARIVTEPLDVLDTKHVGDKRLMAQDVLNSVGLRSADLDKYPHEFSGGQRQRIAIARALITRPKLIVADEPVSALDVSIQAQVLNLMQDLSQEFGVTYLLISHDLAVIDYLCEEVAVMFQGRLVEQAAPQTLFQHAAHPYTRALVDAIPRMIPNPTPGQRKRTVRIAPTQQYGNAACPYASRCPQAQAICGELRPELRTVGEGHRVACHFE